MEEAWRHGSGASSSWDFSSWGRPELRATTNLRSISKLHLRSSVALVQDQRTGEFLVEKQSGAVMPIASITKLMTAMVVLDAGLDLNEPIVIGSEDLDLLRHSRSRLPVNTRLTRGEALLLALMASENRAAHALGRTYPGGLDAFVAAMNTKAKTLGLSESRFEDPAGLSGGNVASARDLAKLVNAAHHYPKIRDFSTRDEATIHSGRRPLSFINTNALVRGHRWNIGLSKTGYIEEAGKCLVMQARVAERPVLIVLLDSWGKYTRLGDAQRIKQWMEGPAPAPVRKRKYRRG
ncbi:MAG: serine hydrolase [Holophaga sp.]|nr:serine hydrolase [Holophaga sp.]